MHVYGLTETYGHVTQCAWNNAWDKFDEEKQNEIKARQGVRYPNTEGISVMDPETMKFEVEVDGLVTSGGLGGLAILHQALQSVSDISKACPDGSISGIGGIRGFREAFNFIVHGAGNLQVCTAAMEEKGSGGIGVKLITHPPSLSVNNNMKNGPA